MLGAIARTGTTRAPAFDMVAGQVGMTLAGGLIAIYAVTVTAFNYALHRVCDAHLLRRWERVDVVERSVVELAISISGGVALGTAAYVGSSFAEASLRTWMGGSSD
ncbi:hypothetical protein [Pararobbsia silviterrae]|nr:hypothetical protein [Pararobbsia silviterrae]